MENPPVNRNNSRFDILNSIGEEGGNGEEERSYKMEVDGNHELDGTNNPILSRPAHNVEEDKDKGKTIGTKQGESKETKLAPKKPKSYKRTEKINKHSNYKFRRWPRTTRRGALDTYTTGVTASSPGGSHTTCWGLRSSRRTWTNGNAVTDRISSPTSRPRILISTSLRLDLLATCRFLRTSLRRYIPEENDIRSSGCMRLQRWIEDLKGMSKFCTFELEDNLWDGFGESDDQLVPLAGDDHKDQLATQGDSSKKRRVEFHGIRSTDNLSSYGTQGKDLPSVTREEIMLEGSHQSEGVFPSSDSESHKEVKRLTLDDTRMSGHSFKNSNIDSIGSELCVDDTVLGDKCVVEDDSVCQYPINHISQADNELSFLDNDGWLDIGNFEDVDRMFRSCDSTFGMGSLNNEEEFCWLSSSHGTEGSDDALKSTFKLSCAEASPLKMISDNNIDSMANIDDLPCNDSNKKASSSDKKYRAQMEMDDDAIPDPISMLTESDMNSGNTDDLTPKEKMQRKSSKPSEGRRKNEYLENGNHVHHCAPVKQYGDVKKPFGAPSSKVTSHVGIQKRKPDMDSDSLGCVQSQLNLPHTEYNQSPSRTSLLPSLSGSRSEYNGHPSPSLKDSSYASNVESSQGHPLEAAVMIKNEKREMLYNHNAVQPSNRGFKNENRASLMPFHCPDSAQQLVHQFENENESHSEVEGVSVGISPETESSNVQETSFMDETSLEACFRQLQPVMEQLDIRTKLCIRDSLYRLAKSAEQRHNYANGNGSIGDDVEACKTMIPQDASGCSGFMDIETDTNPIDRSIAHLLFHRPSDPSMLPPSEK
ncbi:protein LNK1 isoform X1 [Senna tora]|uniref:Protein LNK1 isoform X1 n=1 Tax=Senna tora TaxID=362788 RepID=A0A834XDX7_9FABA|nr:protein LNK1 isoform X1 [Senna tora]